MIFPLWDIMQRPAQLASQRIVCKVLRLAAEAEFIHFLVWHSMGKEDCAADFVHNPVDSHYGKRSGAYQRLRRASREFRDRLASGRVFEFAPMLFDPRNDA